MTHMLRAAGLRGFHALVQRLGGDPEALLRAQRIAPDLDDEEMLIPVGKLVRLLETAARTLGCADFGLRLAQAQDVSILGPVAIAIQNSPTIGEALRIASRYLFVHNQGLSFTPVHESPGRPGLAELRYDVLMPQGLPPARQSFDLMVGGGHRMLSLLGGRHYRLQEVHLPHAALATPAVYAGYFGAPVRFRQRRAALIVPRALFDAPMPHANADLRGFVSDYLEQHFGSGDGADVLPRVKLALLRTIGTSQAGLPQIAALLAIHPRTLQRRLDAKDLRFEDIKDEVMRDAARRYLGIAHMPLAEITTLLGLSEQSALTRSCRRWFGETPSALRRRLAQAPAADR